MNALDLPLKTSPTFYMECYIIYPRVNRASRKKSFFFPQIDKVIHIGFNEFRILFQQ